MYKRFIFTSALALGCAAIAQAAQKEEPASSAKNATRITCASERVTGSHIPKRVCMTDEERERRRQRDQEEMERLRRNPGGARSSSGD